MPGGKGNIRPEDSTQGFDVNPQNAGRHPKLVTHVNKELKEKGYEPVTKSQVLDAYQTLMNLPVSEIKKIGDMNNKDNYPIIYKLVAKELNGKRGAEYLEKLLDRVIGKPKGETDINLPDTININLKRGGN